MHMLQSILIVVPGSQKGLGVGNVRELTGERHDQVAVSWSERRQSRRAGRNSFSSVINARKMPGGSG